STHQTRDHRHIGLDLVERRDNTAGHLVHTGDAAEDIEHHRLDVRVGEDDLERGLNFVLARATANVEEVGRLATVELDHVHGGHGQASPVDHAADVAVEL